MSVIHCVESHLSVVICHQLNETISAVKELSALHDKHLHRPTMDDNVDEKGDIEVQTHETTEVFSFQLCRC